MQDTDAGVSVKSREAWEEEVPHFGQDQGVATALHSPGVPPGGLLSGLSGRFHLGRMYYYGDGVEKDVASGIRLWQHSAIRGHPP